LVLLLPRYFDGFGFSFRPGTLNLIALKTAAAAFSCFLRSGVAVSCAPGRDERLFAALQIAPWSW
jgi:hypothetical protein